MRALFDVHRFSMMQPLEEAEEGFHDPLGGVDLDVARAHPGFIAAERMLAGRRQVAVRAIRELDA